MIGPSQLMSDRNRYSLVLGLAQAGWWLTAIIVTLRAFEEIPASFGLMAVLTVGIAVAASLALSRMKLARTITQVFEAGITSAMAMSEQGALMKRYQAQTARHMEVDGSWSTWVRVIDLDRRTTALETTGKGPADEVLAANGWTVGAVDCWTSTGNGSRYTHDVRRSRVQT